MAPGEGQENVGRRRRPPTGYDAVAAVAHERGERLREEGRGEGVLEGQARAIVDVLHRRNVHLGATDSERILGCRDAATLARWWDRAWHVASAPELFGQS